jgi:hypothetical protein
MLAAVAVLSFVLVPATPVLAAESVEVDPENGEVGERIDITGTDLSVSRIGVEIYFSSDEADTGDEIDDEVTLYDRVRSRTINADGEISTNFVVPDEIYYDGDSDDPEDVVPGVYFLYLIYEDDPDIEAIAEFIVRGIETDPVEGKVGTEVEITGIGFDSREDIDYINFDDEEVDIEDGDTDTDRDGEFVSTILIPEASAGEHTITVRDKGRKEASATFTVEPEIAIRPVSGEAGSQVTVTGTGFGDDKEITITFNGSTVTTDDTDAYGSFSTRFTVPDVSAGSYDVEVEDEDDNKLDTTFSAFVATEASVSPVTSEAAPAGVGTSISVSGSGFKANTAVTITDTTRGALLTTTTSNADGAFQATFEASGSAGQHIVTASDGTDTLAVSFVMESQAPEAPLASLPESGLEVEAQPLLDWADVVDPSGVTYTLQLATSSDFNPAALILEKAGLTASQYTLTEGQALEAGGEEAPYYWRVMATDGAGNVGEWSAPASFFVGSTFEISAGIQYALMGVGGLALLALGFWLGRRTSYSAF